MTGPTRYRTFPVEVEAMRWDGTEASQAQIVSWSKGAVSGWFDGTYYLSVETPDGAVRADVGDWIVRWPDGRLRRVAPEDFVITYEPVEAP